MFIHFLINTNDRKLVWIWVFVSLYSLIACTSQLVRGFSVRTVTDVFQLAGLFYCSEDHMRETAL